MIKIDQPKPGVHSRLTGIWSAKPSLELAIIKLNVGAAKTKMDEVNHSAKCVSATSAPCRWKKTSQPSLLA